MTKLLLKRETYHKGDITEEGQNIIIIKRVTKVVLKTVSIIKIFIFVKHENKIIDKHKIALKITHFC